ncbi:MAG: VOC family protein [Dehalococcoidia bacterium]|jgi:catechol 2,3-dioxygenase-like lactoylglutathione lyase family enzyme|nr:VOC family protein [Dehalococcoidia bacterium]
MLKRLDNVGVAVTDLARAHDFYTRVLGMESGPLSEGAGGFSAALGDVALYVFTTEASGSPGRDADMNSNPPGIDHLAFEVDDYEGAQRELEARDVAFVHDSVGEAGGFRYRGFHDPDGNMIYIIDRGS